MNNTPAKPRTLYDKLWSQHEVCQLDDTHSLIYIDRHLVHEVTSPQAFSGLKLNQRKVLRPQSILAVPDHNVPTTDRASGISDPVAALQTSELVRNCQENELNLIPLADQRQGIVHIVGPELGFTLPGLTIVCGDSHTSTHGAFGSLAFGIGTSDVEHVLATQCLKLARLKNMKVRVDGVVGKGVYAKDVILKIIHDVGVVGGIGHCVEYCGQVIEQFDMEQRMTICNMSIEMGARVGLVAVDEQTLNYLNGRPKAPTGENWQRGHAYWQTLTSDPDSVFAKSFHLQAEDIAPMVTWGTNPQMSSEVSGQIPNPSAAQNEEQAKDIEQALAYMDLRPGTAMEDICPEYIFIGSCTNSRLSDLRIAANVVKGKKLSSRIHQALVVPGSGQVKAQAEQEGLDRIFIEAGFEWRYAGCSMCLGMNPDRLQPGNRCASTSNRNFIGRQGRGSRTHLMSPAMAAAAAISGHIVDVREIL